MSHNSNSDQNSIHQKTKHHTLSSSSLTLQEKANELYSNKQILAPMVRASTTPLRTLALEYGADLVYTEEIIDRSMIHNCDRVVNDELGTIDYCRSMASFSKKQRNRILREAEKTFVSTKSPNGKHSKPSQEQLLQQATPVILRIVPELERGKLIYQMGTGDPTLALEAALKVCHDVDGIDVNMGCPKKFSVCGGMGSALLSDVHRAADIIKTLRRNLSDSLPVSCKIRLLETTHQTIDFVKAMEMAGVNAIAVHAREVGDDSTMKAKWERLEPVIQSVKGQIPTIINGDLYTQEMIQEVLQMTKADSVMLARPALYNTSVFAPKLKEKSTVIQDYIQHAVRWRTNPKNTKYVICEMMNNRRHPHHWVSQLPQCYPKGQTISDVCSMRTMQDICRLWDVNMSEAMRVTTTTTTSPPSWKTDKDVTNGLEEEEETRAFFAQPTTEHNYHDDYFLKERAREETRIQTNCEIVAIDTQKPIEHEGKRKFAEIQ